MLNGQALNAGPLNSSGFGSAQKPLAVNATASATIAAPALSVRRTLGVAATATGTFPSTDLVRRRGLAITGTATAEVFAGISIEKGGIVQAYLAAYPTATATVDPPALRASAPLAADLAATATADIGIRVRRAVAATGTATGAIDAPFLSAFVNLGDLPPGQDSIVGSKRIRAFGFAAVEMRRRRRLSVVATATAFIFPLPRAALQVRLAATLTAGTTDDRASSLYVRRRLEVAADATATVEAISLFAYIRLGINAAGVAVIDAPSLYMNTFDQAPTVRTVFVAFNPRVTQPTRIRRELDA